MERHRSPHPAPLRVVSCSRAADNTARVPISHGRLAHFMTPSTRKCHRFLPLLLLAGCASVPPPNDILAEATRLLEKARDEQALTHAPQEMRIARERLDQARMALDTRDYAQAGRLAEQSEVNTLLAIERARAARVRQAVSEQERANQALRRELLGEGRR